MSENAGSFEKAINLIDQFNREDPNYEVWQGESYPKEFLYSQRMSECLNDFAPNATLSLKIAARAQHIGRWKIPRSAYPDDRKGYLKWRNELKAMHASITAEILQKSNFSNAFIEEVSDLIQKKNLKKNPDTQTLEDVICLVFLKYYLEDFSQKKDDSKLIEILKKTWRKMSEEGQNAAATLSLSARVNQLINKALA